jgi:type I restriction enzyme S subunit
MRFTQGGEWQVISAAAYCESVRDGTHDSPKFTDTGYPLITSKNIKQGQLELASANLISEADFSDINRRSKVDKWDVLFSMIGTVGEVCLVREDDPSFAIKNIGLFKCGDELKGLWLYYWFTNPTTRAALRQENRGASQQFIPLGALRELQIRVPPCQSLQRRIISILSSYDDLIENNRRRMALLEDSARQLYREWFVRLRFPGHEHTPVVDGVPQGWERRTAFEAMQVLSGGTPKTSISDYWDGETPFFTPKDAVDGIWVSSCERSLTELGIKNCNSKLYPRETVFITARGTVGKLNMAQTPMAMSQSCYALVAKDHLSQRFIYSAMKEGVEALRQQAVGAVFDAIVVDTFKRIHLTVPTAAVLRMFDEAVEPVFAQVENLASQNQKLRQARDLLLPRLMNGELAV